MTISKFQIGEVIEKYRLVIGGGLVLLILAGAGLLLYRENFSKVSTEDKLAAMEEKIKQLESDKSEALNTKSETNQNVQNPNDQNQEQAQGQVAGVSSQTADGGILKQVQDDTKKAGSINLNTATLAQLDSLPGIGPVYAQRIIDYRTEKGGFKSIDEVKNVKGIGDKTFEKFKDQISI